MMALSPEAIGRAAALDAWACRGRSLFLRARPYHEAVSELAGRCEDDDDFDIARRAFDRRLCELAGTSSTLIRHVDQFGEAYWAYSLRELRDKVGGGRVAEMYVEGADGGARQVGYVIGGRCFNAFVPKLYAPTEYFTQP